MNKKEIFKEIADRYMPKCIICKSNVWATHKITPNSKIGSNCPAYCCSMHLKEAANTVIKHISNVDDIKIDKIVVGDLYKSILFFDLIDDITVDAFNDLLEFVPLCNKCECHSAIYKAYIPCTLDSEMYLCKSCGIAISKLKNNRYEIKDMDTQEAVMQIEELICG